MLIALLALINLFVFFCVAKLYPSEGSIVSEKKDEDQEEEED